MPDDATIEVCRHLPPPAVPLALAELHRTLAPAASAVIGVDCRDDGRDHRATEPFAGEGSTWVFGEFEELCRGAGFQVEAIDRLPDGDPDGTDGTEHQPAGHRVHLRRLLTLPDTIGPGMRLLICGLNPSPYSAEVGVGFGRPGNRFWPAARAAGVVTVTGNDPFGALRHDAVGMTDLVKRVTRRADELDAAEYRQGLDRVDRLVGWLKPRAVCFVGLAGWRAAIDRGARAGVQGRTIGDRPAYLMPSTSGLNAHATFDSLVGHLADAGRLADDSPT